MSLRFNLPSFTLPPGLAALGARLPQWPHTLVLVGILNLAVRLGLFAGDDLERLEGHQFQIEVLDTGGRARFTCRGGCFQPLFGAAEKIDLLFRAPLSAYLQLLTRQEDPDTLFFNRQLSIEGDTALGLTVKNMLDGIECPQLAQLIQRWRDKR